MTTATEEKRELKTFEVRAKCTECANGYMQWYGDILASNPPQYPHKCDKCGCVDRLTKHYPYIQYEVISIDVDA